MPYWPSIRAPRSACRFCITMHRAAASRLDRVMGEGDRLTRPARDERLVLARAQGTTSSRAILCDARGRPVASAARPFAQRYPRPGWGEHDPDDLWSTTIASAREVLARAEAGPARVAAIGVANQRET